MTNKVIHKCSQISLDYSAVTPFYIILKYLILNLQYFFHISRTNMWFGNNLAHAHLFYCSESKVSRVAQWSQRFECKHSTASRNIAERHTSSNESCACHAWLWWRSRSEYTNSDDDHTTSRVTLKKVTNSDVTRVHEVQSSKRFTTLMLRREVSALLIYFNL